MFKHKLLPVLLVSLLLSGCGESEVVYETTHYDFSVKSIMILDENHHEIDLNYNYYFSTEFFDKDSTIFNKDLALNSFVGAFSCNNKDLANKYYGLIGFNDIYYSSDFGKEETKETVLFTVAHKSLHDSDLFTININGRNYDKPWEYNFLIGESGDAFGFKFGADKIYGEIKDYLAKYPNKKIWINGYSRGGGIANVLAHQLVDLNVVSEKNLYVYTFESPRTVDYKLGKEYKSVFNIYNSGDLVAAVAPGKYGLKRLGTSINVYNSLVDNIAKKFNPKVIMTPFTSKSDSYSNETEFINYIVTNLTKEFANPDKGVYDLSTRESYSKHYENEVVYLYSLYNSVSYSTYNALMDKISHIGFNDILTLLSQDGFYKFIQPILEEYHEEYDDAMLKQSLNAIQNLVANNISFITLFLQKEARDNIIRAAEFHSPETVLPLLLAYNPQ